MNQFYFYISFVSWLCLCSLWGIESLKISLEQAEDWVIENNYQLQADLHSAEQGYYGYRAAGDYFLPSLSVRASADFAKQRHGVDAVVKLTQPLYDKLAHCRLKEAQMQWEYLKLEWREKICHLLFEVRRAYDEILLHSARLEMDRMVIELWQEELKRVERSADLGASILYEVQEAKFHLNNAWIDYYSTERKRNESQIQFLSLLSLPSDTPLELEGGFLSLQTVEDGLGGTSQTLVKENKEEVLLGAEKRELAEKWIAQAFSFCPALQKARFACWLSRNQMEQVKAERYPTVSLYANAGHAYVNNGFDQQPNVGVGLNVEGALYSPVNRQKIKQAQAGRQSAASRYEEAELQVTAKTHRLLSEIEHCHRIYRTAKEGALLAEEGRKVAARKHEEGAMSAFEYRESVKNFREAQLRVIQAQADWRNAYHRLVEHAGIDLIF